MIKLLTINNYIQLYDAVTEFCTYDEVKLYKVYHPVHTHAIVSHTWHCKKVKDAHFVADIDYDLCKDMIKTCNLYYNYLDDINNHDDYFFEFAYPFHHAIFINGKWQGVNKEGDLIEYIEVEKPINNTHCV